MNIQITILLTTIFQFLTVQTHVISQSYYKMLLEGTITITTTMLVLINHIVRINKLILIYPSEI